jgi:hypothetical protein
METTVMMNAQPLEPMVDYDTFRTPSLDAEPMTTSSALPADTGKDVYLVLLGCSFL